MSPLRRRARALGGRRLVLVVAGGLILLAGGALAYYGVTHSGPKPGPTPREDQPPDDRGEPLRVAGKKLTVPVRPAEAAKIDLAVARGVWYLQRTQQDSGSWAGANPGNPGDMSVGLAALPALTLLECGLPDDDPVVQKAADYVRSHAMQEATNYDTYQLALAILFLDRLGKPQDEERIQFMALRLVAGQRDGPDGGWGYKCPPLDKSETPKLLDLLQDDNQSLGQWRQAALHGTPFDPGQTDNSNSQFAILALWVAKRHGTPIERSIALVEARLRDSQQPPGSLDAAGNDQGGGWPYNSGGGKVNDWPSMTCAGLLGLAVAQGTNGSKVSSPLDDPAVHQALDLLGRHIDRPNETRPPDLYFMWSLARVAVIYNLPEIGEKDWYGWGCKAVLPLQQTDGCWKASWLAGGNDAVATCFALLFLKQANLAEDLTNKIHGFDKK